MRTREKTVTITVPFIIGVWAGILLSGAVGSDLSVILTLSAAAQLASISLIGISAIRRNDMPVPLLLSLYLIAGLFCALNGSLCEAVPSGGGIMKSLGACMDGMKRIIGEIPYVKPTSAALVSALTTGDRSLLENDIVSVFRSSGASHILALSGLHLGILYLMLSSSLSCLGNSPLAKRIKFLIIGGLTVVYALATGASPSICRAAVFILIRESAKFSHRTCHLEDILFGALLLQSAFSPMSVKSVGFQLSYLAMLGICLVYPILESWYPKGSVIDLPHRIWQGVSLAVSCQIFTGPLAYLRFGTFPKYFILTNLLAMPLTTAVMVSSVTVILLSAAGVCPLWAVRLNEFLIDSLLWLLDTISSM